MKNKKSSEGKGIKELTKRICVKCGKPAKYEVRSIIGNFYCCGVHAKKYQKNDKGYSFAMVFKLNV